MLGKSSMQVSLYALHDDERKIEVTHFRLPQASGVNAVEIDIGGSKITLHGLDDMFMDLANKIEQAVQDSWTTRKEKAVNHE